MIASSEKILPPDVIELVAKDPTHWDAKGVLHLKDDTVHKRGLFGWIEKIWLPVVGLLLTATIAWIGHTFTRNQDRDAQIQRLTDRVIQASTTRQTVLTEYAKRTTDIQATSLDSGQKAILMRGETLIALQRLDDSRGEERKGEVDEVIASVASLLDLDKEKDRQELANRTKDLKGFDNSGKLKGYLVRFLRETNQLVTSTTSPQLPLWNADLRRVVLNNQPLFYTTAVSDEQGKMLDQVVGVDLRGVIARWGEFANAGLEKADLRSADLRDTKLEGANLRGTDLRKTDLTGANLADADLTGACYSKDTKGLDKIDPQSLGMRDATNADPKVPCWDLP